MFFVPSYFFDFFLRSLLFTFFFAVQSLLFSAHSHSLCCCNLLLLPLVLIPSHFFCWYCITFAPLCSLLFLLPFLYNTFFPPWFLAIVSTICCCCLLFLLLFLLSLLVNAVIYTIAHLLLFLL